MTVAGQKNHYNVKSLKDDCECPYCECSISLDDWGDDGISFGDTDL